MANPFEPIHFGEKQKHFSRLARADAEQLASRAKYVPHGRYRSLFETHLEMAMMFLNKAIAFDGVLETPNTAADSASTNPDEEIEDG